MARLIIRQLKYDGLRYEYKSPYFKSGLNIIQGTNGSGKSTFSNLLYYAIGGNVEIFNKNSRKKHLEITSDNNNYVKLLIQIDSKIYTLIRFISKNDILVTSEEGDVDLFPVNRSSNAEYIFSDFILEKLGIEPVELAMGPITWKINIKDIFRLMFHDQAPNPHEIYKSPDSSNFISDSKVIRKAIFEVLVGKKFYEYYKALSDLRHAASKREQLKGAADLYKNMVTEINLDNEDINIVFLKRQYNEKKLQIDRLETFLDELNTSIPAPTESLAQLENLKDNLLSLEFKLNGLQKDERSSLEEFGKLRAYKIDLMTEVTQIKKMTYTHEKLSLFSADTCPYCLKEVKREKG